MKIQVIDLHFQGRPQCVAAFLISTGSGHLLVECGPSPCRPYIVAALEQHGLKPADLQGLLLTHIHLDHAGDAGWWAQQGVTVYVHPIGAPHLVDPSKLLASATRIYGDAMERLWGEIVPCPADKVVAWEPDTTRKLAGVSVTAWDSPGHARHHLAYQFGNALLCGDVAAVRLPSLDGSPTPLSVPAPPPEFDREVWLQTIDKLSVLPVEQLYLTHFGAHGQPAAHWAELKERVDAVAEFVGDRRDHPREQLVQEYQEWQKPHFGDESTYDRYEQANPLFMSIDGLLRYWKKRSA